MPRKPISFAQLVMAVVAGTVVACVGAVVLAYLVRFLWEVL